MKSRAGRGSDTCFSPLGRNPFGQWRGWEWKRGAGCPCRIWHAEPMLWAEQEVG